MIERLDRFGRDELEDNRVSGKVPAKHGAKDADDGAVARKYQPPDGVAGAIGDHQRDKVGAGRGGSALEGKRDGKAVEESAEHNLKQDVVERRQNMHLGEGTQKERG